MVVGEAKRTQPTNIMDGIENTGDVRLHDHRLRLKQRFDIVRKLGQGTYGKVQLGINKKTGQEVAIKTIKKCKIESEADLVRIRREVQIMSSVRHPNIVHIYEVFENSEKMILVMEYCSGGELYDYLSQKKVLEEEEARRLFRQIATAVYYCHIHKICHRDLKLENVLLDDTGSAKIADFGLSNVFKETSLLSTFCGSPLYASPEIVKGTPYIGPEVDCWSLGVLLYTLVYGAMPFDGSNFKRLVRQISNGDYYEPKNPSTASPLIRDMLTVDPLKRADIAYICDHPWVNAGCPSSCLELAQALAAETPVRLDLLLSLAPAAASHTNSVVVPTEAELRPEESCTDLTSSTSIPVEPSNSAEKRILELVAEGGEDAIKPSPTRTIVSAGDNKRKLELAMSASGLHRKKEKVASCASVAQLPAALPEEGSLDSPPADEDLSNEPPQPCLKSSATITIAPAPVELAKDATVDIVKQMPKQEVNDKPTKKVTSPKIEEKSPFEKQEEIKQVEEQKPASVATTTDKLTSLTLTQPTPAAAPAPAPAPAPSPAKPKKLSIGGHVGSFKEQFERRASLTSAPEIKRNVSKPVVSKIAKAKAQSEDRDLPAKSPDNGTVRLQQIGIEPSQAPVEESREASRSGVKKTESEPMHNTPQVDPTVLLQDARRSLQNSMAKLVEEKAGEESRRRAARDIISSAIRTGKPPMPYGRSSPRRISSLVSGGESEEEDDTHMHRLRSTRAARAESVSSGEEDEEDEGFHLLTAENLFSTLLHRVRALTQRLNGEEGPGFPQHPHSLFNNLQSPFFNSPHLPRRHLLREGWGSRELHSDWESMFNKSRQPMPRGSCKKAGKKQQTSKAQQTETERGLDLSDLDLSSIEFSEREMAALSGLTPALSRRLQQQLLAHLPPAAARSLRRTLSLHAASPAAAAAAPPRHRAHRSHSASKYSEPTNSDVLDRLAPLHDKQPPAPTHEPDTKLDLEENNISDQIRDDGDIKGVPRRYLRGHSVKSIDDDTSKDNTPEQNIDRTAPQSPKNDPKRVDDLIAQNEKIESINKNDDMDLATSSHLAQFCTLPRLKRGSVTSRDSTSPVSIADSIGYDFAAKNVGKEPSTSRASSIRNSQDRPLLSKYLIPERHFSLDESYTSDSGSIISEPSYIAAYGTSSLGNTSGLGFRRHSMRLPGDQPRKRISRFLRSDFYDTPPDDSLYAKHKKEKELETQKILKEIREKKNKSLDSPKSPVECNETSILNKDESAYLRKCLSPVGNLLSRERSRSTTPFFPILDNIKETNLDTSLTITDAKKNIKNDLRKSSLTEEKLQNKESKMKRPKSYPVKSFNSLEETGKTGAQETIESIDREIEERKSKRESKLIRPKSYPATTPSPEKINSNKNEMKKKDLTSKDEHNKNDTKSDVEVSFNFTLPKKKSLTTKSETLTKNNDLTEEKTEFKQETSTPALVLKKYKIINEDTDTKSLHNTHTGNGTIVDNATLNGSVVEDNKVVEIKKSESDTNKKTVKKKVIKKVSSKSKTDVISNQESIDGTNSTDKKKVVKKVKEKSNEDNKATAVKKKSVLQSIGHKLEKLASSKSNSPEKSSQSSIASKELKKACSKLNRLQREQSVPVETDPPTESNLIKRAVTLTDVAALDSQNVPQNKTTVSKVLGLFKKFESKEKSPKSVIENCASEDPIMSNSKSNKFDTNTETNLENEKDKPKRPTSLLLNGLGRKNKYNKSASDSVSVISLETDEQPVLKKDREPKGVRNTLKLDFSKLPRVKKIVPTNPVIEPQIMNVSLTDKENEKKNIVEKSQIILDSNDANDIQSRSRSRSRSIYSNSDVKSEHSAEIKGADKFSETFTGNSALRLIRNKDSISPEKEDIVDRIRRKSFYSRFNEKKQRRKSSLVGPGATEYDPVARLHSQPAETKLDVSPSSPINYDLSPGYSIASDLSPSTDRYRSLLTDLPSNRGLRYDSINDKIDTYRSLDRNDLRKYSSGRSYLDYDQPGTYGGHRYSRTKSLLENCDGNEDHGLSHLRDPVKYSRTNSLYTPGNYATYRPKRTRNSAIILKESEKEPSPENILEKIRNRKISISVTRKADSEDSLPRSNVSSKSEGDCAERSEKTD
ncbi:PREDICTED: uncharacterized protein LOC106100100 [Papilio polytes]|uniref:uncharacterized protein LOC106100100 n=1 Tax=Papilio polytes TaxID=76194 RepID=UPI000675C632|nr:PREDICTED: uncharacterized protein LOC106100100 [Papilio polytes]